MRYYTDLRIHTLSERIAISLDRGFETPRYDRNMFHYISGKHKWKVHYKKLDSNYLVSDAIFSAQIVDKMCLAISNND